MGSVINSSDGDRGSLLRFLTESGRRAFMVWDPVSNLPVYSPLFFLISYHGPPVRVGGTGTVNYLSIIYSEFMSNNGTRLKAFVYKWFRVCLLIFSPT